MMIYLENPRDSSKKLLETINNFGKVAGYKIYPHKSSAFLYITNKAQHQNIEREIPFKAIVDTVKYLESTCQNKPRDYMNKFTKHFSHK